MSTKTNSKTLLLCPYVVQNVVSALITNFSVKKHVSHQLACIFLTVLSSDRLLLAWGWRSSLAETSAPHCFRILFLSERTQWNIVHYLFTDKVNFSKQTLWENKTVLDRSEILWILVSHAQQANKSGYTSKHLLKSHLLLLHLYNWSYWMAQRLTELKTTESLWTTILSRWVFRD